jgi:hypothetical protein
MSFHKPLVIIGGQLQQLPNGSYIEGSTTILEPVVVAGFNGNVSYIDGDLEKVPMLITTSDGDIITAGVENAA